MELATDSLDPYKLLALLSRRFSHLFSEKPLIFCLLTLGLEGLGREVSVEDSSSAIFCFSLANILAHGGERRKCVVAIFVAPSSL